MSSPIAIEAAPPLAEEMQRWVRDRRAPEDEDEAAAECVVLVHDPPRLDALARLGGYIAPDGLPRAAVVVVAAAADRALRHAALRAGAMEVLEREAIDRVTFVSAIDDARARFSMIRRAAAAAAERCASAERFRELADHIAHIAWIGDSTGAVTWYNRRWFEYTGASPDDADAWSWVCAQHPDHLERVLAKVRGHVESGEPWEDTYPLRGADGQWRWFLARAVPSRDASGRVACWFGTATDVTAQRRAEAALIEADRRKNDFIAILAHELRNPLAPIRTAVHILRKLGPPEPRLDRARDVIDRQVTHMARLIDDLLDVSRIARGKLALQKETCDLAAIARQTAEDYRASLEDDGITLLAPESSAPVWVDGDPVRLAQMVGNLLQNAGRFTGAGGRVEVRTELDAAGGLAVVRVTDTGVGIDPALLPRLFDPFSQADQGLARTKGGLGLGLALTKGLAELHGGTVAAESEGIGRGATFVVRIPLSAAKHADVPSAEHLGRAGRPLRIVVVEDNRDAAETLRDLLELAGDEVELAPDGATAVAVAERLAPDVVISDIGLPGQLDGYGVARTLRADRRFEKTYLIALSGYANEDAQRLSRQAGFDTHLAKPPDIDALERTLEHRREQG